MKRVFTLLGPVLLAAGLLAPTAAEAAPQPRHAVVDIRDLDLATAKGQDRLAVRVHRAARKVCEAEALDSLPQTVRARRDCVRQAKAAAMMVVEAGITQSADGSVGG